ncbi:MAG: 5-aminopentanamidase [Chloroflexota bacterium]|nr:5-aminopentanamidase [Chloroflexota bacterium]
MLVGRAAAAVVARGDDQAHDRNEQWAKEAEPTGQLAGSGDSIGVHVGGTPGIPKPDASRRSPEHNPRRDDEHRAPDRIADLGRRRATAATAVTAIDGLVVAVAQVGPSIGDVAANLALARRYLRRAAARGAHLVIFPECFLQSYALRRAVLELAEPLDGPAVTALAAMAAEKSIAVVAGLIETNGADPGKPFNSAVVIDRAGQIVGAYRKAHLFDREFDAFTPGDAYPVFEVAVGADRAPVRLGVCICADIEFPEVARLLAIGGAQLIAVASADMEPYRVQQAANLMSRSIENNVPVALANTVDHRPAVTFFGGSGIATPDGRLIAAGYGRPRLVTATLTDAAITASGGAGSSLRDRRIDTYGRLLEPRTGQPGVR